MLATPNLHDVLRASVEFIGGCDRPGQIAMAESVDQALAEGSHLLVQAGTGTGKSLAYLVPALLHDKRVVIATATLNLQHQLVERDIPALQRAVHDSLETVPTHAVVKGRGNYACLHRIREGVPDEQDTLIEAPVGSLGDEVLELRSWAEGQVTSGGPGDRETAPPHSDRAWRQVSVQARECLGAARCGFAQECFAENAREQAADADLVVTNHALLAIDAIDGVPMLPDYDAVIVDEAHELVARVTQASTGVLSVGLIERAARRARSVLTRESSADAVADDIVDAASALADALAATEFGRIDILPESLQSVLGFVRDSARACWSALPKESGDTDAANQQARAAVDEVRKIAGRMAAHAEADVLWLTENRGAYELHVAPLDVSASLRDKLFATNTVILTSATLTLGGRFDAVAAAVGLRADDDEVRWESIDVGSPFNYSQQAMLYVAKHLPPPGRDGPGEAHISEIAELISSAGGRTLGLFTSRRAAEFAAESVRERLPSVPILCQGDAQLPELVRQFSADPRCCLFGTLSLWQGIDIPGETCHLVIIDRIPFPRPDDPLMSARQRLVEKHGGNGFMTVAANHAALLLAQGTGRLIRSTTDKGVVAVLDSRLVTARYGRFLADSLPPMWRTTDQRIACGALQRLDQSTQSATTREIIGPSRIMQSNSAGILGA